MKPLIGGAFVLAILSERSNSMNANPTINTFPALGAHLLGLLLVAGALALSFGVRLPFITNHRTAMIVLLVVGVAVCSIGGLGRVSAGNAWTHPLSILGYGIGILILLIVGAALLGRSLPLIRGERASMIAIGGLMVVKIILTQLHPLLR